MQGALLPPQDRLDDPQNSLLDERSRDQARKILRLSEFLRNSRDAAKVTLCNTLHTHDPARNLLIYQAVLQSPRFQAHFDLEKRRKIAPHAHRRRLDQFAPGASHSEISWSHRGRTLRFAASLRLIEMQIIGIALPPLSSLLPASLGHATLCW